jgi:hypothetical protein
MWDAFFILDFSFDIRHRITRLHLEGDRFACRIYLGFSPRARLYLEPSLLVTNQLRSVAV